MKRICFLLSIIVLGIVTASAQETITSQEEETVFITVEEQPEFPGGFQSLIQYLSQNIIYPQESRASGSQGKVFVRFVVDTDGSISDAEVIRSSGDIHLDREAVRVVKSMPKWKPGKLSGRAVRVYYTLPVSFKLYDPVSTDGKNETNGAQQ